MIKLDATTASLCETTLFHTIPERLYYKFNLYSSKQPLYEGISQVVGTQKGQKGDILSKRLSILAFVSKSTYNGNEIQKTEEV